MINKSVEMLFTIIKKCKQRKFSHLNKFYKGIAVLWKIPQADSWKIHRTSNLDAHDNNWNHKCKNHVFLSCGKSPDRLGRGSLAYDTPGSNSFPPFYLCCLDRWRLDRAAINLSNIPMILANFKIHFSFENKQKKKPWC